MGGREVPITDGRCDMCGRETAVCDFMGDMLCLECAFSGESQAHDALSPSAADGRLRDMGAGASKSSSLYYGKCHRCDKESVIYGFFGDLCPDCAGFELGTCPLCGGSANVKSHSDLNCTTETAGCTNADCMLYLADNGMSWDLWQELSRNTRPVAVWQLRVQSGQRPHLYRTKSDAERKLRQLHESQRKNYVIERVDVKTVLSDVANGPLALINRCIDVASESDMTIDEAVAIVRARHDKHGTDDAT